MFRLQRLEISGFKSFADYTEIIFDSEGITAIVGPNGCGKSNLSDCLTWVLGEQRAKALRGGEMRDVIFQGSKNRQPSGMAEVILHLVRDESFVSGHETDEFDDTLADFDEHSAISFDTPVMAANGHSHAENGFELAQTAAASVSAIPHHIKRHLRKPRINLDFAPGEAVSITRRLYRSGESEYLLNGRACRLRDIHDLFSGTGLSGAHYALIEQGRIGQILSAKPSDRRALIEEAAGITKFRTRQRAAEIRLESAKTNLRRLSDIIAEVERQAASLRRQAAKTRRYKQMRDKWRELLRQVFTAEGVLLNQTLTVLKEKIASAISEEQNLISDLSECETASWQATKMARETEEKLTKLREIAAEKALQRDRTQREAVYQAEQFKNLEQRISAFRQEHKATEIRRQQTANDVKRLREKNQQQQSSGDSEAETIKNFEDNYRTKLNKVRAFEAEIEKSRSELLQHTAASERLREISRQLEATAARLAERAAGLQIEGERANTTHEEKIAEAQHLQSELAKIHERLKDLRQQKPKALQLVTESNQALKTTEANFYRLRDESNGLRHRIETLQKVDAGHTLFAPVVQKLLAAEDQIGVKISGTLADKLQVKAEHERAVEAVFGEFLQTVLVEKKEDALKIHEWLRQQNSGKLTVLATSPKTKNQKPKTENLIRHLLGVSDDLADVLQQVFPVQMNFLIVRDFIEAFEIETNCVTLNGEIVTANNLFQFGKANGNEKNHSILAFKRELRELQKQSEQLITKLTEAENTVQTEKANVLRVENKLKELEFEISRLERETMTREVFLKSLQEEISRAERHRKIVSDETRQIETERKEIFAKREKTLHDAKTAEQLRSKTAKLLDNIALQLTEAKKQADDENLRLSQKRAEFAAANERRRSLANALKRSESELNDLTVRHNKLETELNEAVSRRYQVRSILSELDAQIVAAETENEAEILQINQVADELKITRERADQLRAKLNELNHQSAGARENRAAQEIQQAETLTRLQNLQTNCHNELNISLDELTLPLINDFDLSEGKVKLEILREKIESFGAVNLLALEELSEAEERLLFLTSQKKDIVDGIASAEEALGEIKNRSRERFVHAFNEINLHFTEFFHELFGGGRGEMNLIEAQDVLESGIEIIAQPPGKRLQNLLLLSGGEKAMTAIALVMAIFKYRPSPFCLLDEVDAPLDEANVGRFVNKIEQMSEQTQFIIITHNKRTMEAAKALYGVTMEEAGVSKVVSVKFE